MICDKKILPSKKDLREICYAGFHYYLGEAEVRGKVMPVRVGKLYKCPSNQSNQKIDSVFIEDKSKTFQSFNEKFNNSEWVVRNIRNFVKCNQKILIIAGDAGLGKTHLAFAIQNSMKNCIFIRSIMLYDIFRERMFQGYDEIYDDYYNKVLSAKYLIIDDLGSEKTRGSDVMQIHFKDFLDNFAGKLIITTNLVNQKIKYIYGEKIFSRLCARGHSVNLKGKDYRMYGKHSVEKEKEIIIRCKLKMLSDVMYDMKMGEILHKTYACDGEFHYSVYPEKHNDKLYPKGSMLYDKETKRATRCPDAIKGGESE